MMDELVSYLPDVGTWQSLLAVGILVGFGQLIAGIIILRECRRRKNR
jgi:hypothetical protein